MLFVEINHKEIDMFASDYRVIALDVGDVRVGVALSDPSCQFALPHSTLVRKGPEVFKKIFEIIKQNHAADIIIGLPLELSGEEGEQAGKVRLFVKALQKFLADKMEAEPNVVFWDERLTSVQAERLVAGSGLKNRSRRAALDRISAAIILESYLQSRPEK